MSTLAGIALAAPLAGAQVNVLTAHNDIARTGQNLQETILTPANVNPTDFGKLYSWTVNGAIQAQPLYVSGVTIPGKGVHNVVYVATEKDYVYAYDADSNGGVDSTPLWSLSLLTNTTPSGTYQVQWGVAGTPVIDLPSNTMYLVSSEVQGTTDIFRLHALDITTGAEKLGGPVMIQGSVPGTGTASVSGTLVFNPNYEYQRAGLLLLNGVVYVPFGAISDIGPWHGWIFSFSTANPLQMIDRYCTSPNGSGDGIWMGGAGLAAEVASPGQPYGRMFITTGNGAYAATLPYDNTMSYGMSVVDLDLTGGHMTVTDEFTPFDWQVRNAQDGDLGSGGAVLLPKQTLKSGKSVQPLVQIGKTGKIYILDRNNLGGLGTTGDNIVQSVQTPESGTQNWGAGIWGSTAYWNGNIYSGGTNPEVATPLSAYSFVNGQLSTSPTSQTDYNFGSPSPTPSISANGNKNGLLWAIDAAAYPTSGPAVLLAFDATNVDTVLYSSNAHPTRDNPGKAVKFAPPTIANGKVYVPTANQISVYGLFALEPQAQPPVIAPAGSTFTGSQSVTITDATPGASIYYTVNGTTPTTQSKLYTAPILVTSNETITAIASATGYLISSPAAASFYSTANTPNPAFSLSAGTYTGAQTLTMTDSAKGATIYYTVDGSTPTTASHVYSGPLSVAATETVQAIAISPGLLASSVATAAYTIQPVYTIDFSQGFAAAVGPMKFNGNADLDDFRLQLSNGGSFETSSVYYATPVNIQSFTTDFHFQLSNAVADGFTFTIQNQGVTALGHNGGNLGYAGIGKSVAIKFDIYNDAGEGINSTGLYIDGASPTVPSIDLTGTGINLHNGNFTDAHVTYDGKILTLTLTDELSQQSWSTSFAVDIPTIVGGPTAYVGFTGGSGAKSSSQKLVYWTYLAGPLAVPNFPGGFDGLGLSLNGTAAYAGSSVELTNGSQMQAASVYYSTPVDIESFTTTFDFQMTKETANGMTFILQANNPTALGANGSGLGFQNIPNSVAIKFDIVNDSTGVYVNGADPSSVGTSLAKQKLLILGHVIRATVTYDGTNLAWTLVDISDLTVHRSTSQSVAIKIPATIQSNTAYVGFTGSTGTGTAVQNVLDWTFTNP
jgi:hypothetical protein